MWRAAWGIVAVLLIVPPASAEISAQDDFLELKKVRLWDAAAPGAKGQDESDVPSLTVFRPEKHHANGTAVIVAPGGAYIGLSSNLEGRQVADWFAAHGVTAFLLKYRLAPN